MVVLRRLKSSSNAAMLDACAKHFALPRGAGVGLRALLAIEFLVAIRYVLVSSVQMIRHLLLKALRGLLPVVADDGPIMVLVDRC